MDDSLGTRVPGSRGCGVPGHAMLRRGTKPGIESCSVPYQGYEFEQVLTSLCLSFVTVTRYRMAPK